MTLPKTTLEDFCKAFIVRELECYKSKPIWMSYWPVMIRMIERADELGAVFDELVKTFGYSDKYEGFPPSNSYIWLTLEHIWMSIDFKKKEIRQTRKELSELKELKEIIIDLSERLSTALRRQNELFESSGFIKADYQTVIDMIEDGSQDNPFIPLVYQRRYKL